MLTAETLSRVLSFHKTFNERQAALAAFTSPRRAEPTRNRSAEISEGISDRLAELGKQIAESVAVAEQAGYERRRIANAKYKNADDVVPYENATTAKSEAAANVLPVGEFMLQTRGKSTTKTQWVTVANWGRRSELAAMLVDGSAKLDAGVVEIVL